MHLTRIAGSCVFSQVGTSVPPSIPSPRFLYILPPTSISSGGGGVKPVPPHQIFPWGNLSYAALDIQHYNLALYIDWVLKVWLFNG